MSEHFRVVVRCRPSAEEKAWKLGDNSLEYAGREGEDATFTFDHVFGDVVSHAELYEKSVAPLVASALQGSNVAVVAYGLPCTGKSHTVFGTAGQTRIKQEARGVIVRCGQQLFDALAKEQRDSSVSRITATFCHVFEDGRVADLFNTQKRNLDISGNPCTLLYSVSGLTEHSVTSGEEIMRLVEKGYLMRNATGCCRETPDRRLAPTTRPLQQYRTHCSHAVFTFTIEYLNKTVLDSGTKLASTSRITVVDLAGKSIEALHSGVISSDSGIETLHKIITTLPKDGTVATANLYPKSSLSKLLKPCFGGNCRTVIIGTISLSESLAASTKKCLEMLESARKIKNYSKPVHAPLQQTTLGKLLQEAENLKAQVAHNLQVSASITSWEVMSESAVKINSTLHSSLSSSCQELLKKIGTVEAQLIQGGKHVKKIFPQMVGGKPVVVGDPLAMLRPTARLGPLTRPAYKLPATVGAGRGLPKPLSPLTLSVSVRQLQKPVLQQETKSQGAKELEKSVDTEGVVSESSTSSEKDSESDSEAETPSTPVVVSGPPPPPLRGIPHIKPDPTHFGGATPLVPIRSPLFFVQSATKAMTTPNTEAAKNSGVKPPLMMPTRPVLPAIQHLPLKPKLPKLPVDSLQKPDGHSVRVPTPAPAVQEIRKKESEEADTPSPTAEIPPAELLQETKDLPSTSKPASFSEQELNQTSSPKVAHPPATESSTAVKKTQKETTVSEPRETKTSKELPPSPPDSQPREKEKQSVEAHSKQTKVEDPHQNQEATSKQSLAMPNRKPSDHKPPEGASTTTATSSESMNSERVAIPPPTGHILKQLVQTPQLSVGIPPQAETHPLPFKSTASPQKEDKQTEAHSLPTAPPQKEDENATLVAMRSREEKLTDSKPRSVQNSPTDKVIEQPERETAKPTVPSQKPETQQTQQKHPDHTAAESVVPAEEHRDAPDQDLAVKQSATTVTEVREVEETPHTPKQAVKRILPARDLSAEARATKVTAPTQPDTPIQTPPAPTQTVTSSVAMATPLLTSTPKARRSLLPELIPKPEDQASLVAETTSSSPAASDNDTEMPPTPATTEPPTHSPLPIPPPVSTLVAPFPSSRVLIGPMGGPSPSFFQPPLEAWTQPSRSLIQTGSSSSDMSTLSDSDSDISDEARDVFDPICADIQQRRLLMQRPYMTHHPAGGINQLPVLPPISQDATQPTLPPFQLQSPYHTHLHSHVHPLTSYLSTLASQPHSRADAPPPDPPSYEQASLEGRRGQTEEGNPPDYYVEAGVRRRREQEGQERAEEEGIDTSQYISSEEIHVAAMEGVKASILKRLATRFGVDYRDHVGRTPLMYAVLGNQPKMCEVLLSLGAVVDAKDSTGLSPLLWAAYQAKPLIMKALLCNGADVQACDPEGRTAYHWAVKTPTIQCLRLLSKHAPTGVANKPDQEGLTPLHWAVMCDQTVHIQQLLTRTDADVRIQDKEGRTPLNYAVLNFSPSCIKAILECYEGAVNLTDEKGRTALHYACAEGSADCVRTLLSFRSCNLHCTDCRGTTPLHWAAAANQPGLVQLLLRRGADRAQRDNDEMTSLDHAQHRGHSECVRILQTYGLRRPASALSIASQVSIQAAPPPVLDEHGHVPLRRPKRAFSLSGASVTFTSRLPADGEAHSDVSSEEHLAPEPRELTTERQSSSPAAENQEHSSSTSLTRWAESRNTQLQQHIQPQPRRRWWLPLLCGGSENGVICCSGRSNTVVPLNTDTPTR